MHAATHDLAVVGGGVMGLCTALEARRRFPEARITVLDRSEIGLGASRHAPGIQLALGRTATERDFARRSLKGWERIFPDASWPVGRRLDLLWIASDVGKLREWQLGTGPGLSDGAAWMSRLSGLAAGMVPAGRATLADRCSYSPVRGIVVELAGRLKREGCEIRENFGVDEITPCGDGVDIRGVDARTVRAKRAVVAIGPWLPGSHLVDEADLRVRPRVKKVVAFHLDRQPAPDCPAIAIQEDYVFLIPMIEDGYWLYSFTSNHWDVRPVASELRVDDGDIERGMAILRKWFVHDVPGIASSRVFCDCYGGDGAPFVVPHRSSGRVVFVGGGSGNGFRFAPACAEDAIDRLWSGAEGGRPESRARVAAEAAVSR
ncbi:MAG: FAD-dependent oxidoreductase [Rhizomicrobium sp.]